MFVYSNLRGYAITPLLKMPVPVKKQQDVSKARNVFRGPTPTPKLVFVLNSLPDRSFQVYNGDKVDNYLGLIS